MTLTDELRAKLSEHGIEYEVVDRNIEQNTFWNLNGVRYKYNALVDSQHGCLSICCANFLTPEQAIAATVGNRTDLSKRLREVSGLHAFAELLGFDWTDDSDWTWHDVACAMADAVDAATVGASTTRTESPRSAPAPTAVTGRVTNAGYIARSAATSTCTAKSKSNGRELEGRWPNERSGASA